MKIIYPKEDVHLDRHVSDEIILSCELSRASGVVCWYKDGQKLQNSENIKLKAEGPYRRLRILSSRVEDSGEYVCDTDDDSIFFHLSITGKHPGTQELLLSYLSDVFNVARIWSLVSLRASYEALLYLKPCFFGS